MSTPRIPPRPVDELDDQTRAWVAQIRASSNVNILRTLLWHPDVAAPFYQFGSKLRQGRLPARHLELVILRIAWNCQSPTEWAGHVGPARASGLADQEIDRIADGPMAPGWDPFESTLLQAADELHDHARLSDATWTALAERYDRAQLVELVLVIGNYHLLSYVMNAFEIEPEPDWPVGFPERSVDGS
jgi:alkylhydroperoxidase family enzyme